ncbi:MAG: hypothetical protein V3T77_09290 [Planctomycetota bacterium]
MRITRIALLGLVAVGVGCASMGEMTAIDRAKKITKNLKKGRRIISVYAVEDNPNDVTKTHRTLKSYKRAERLFRDAVKLDPGSSQPRIALANCLQLISLVHYNKYQTLEDELKKARDPSPRLQEETEHHKTEYRRYSTESNRVFLFYARNLMSHFPNPMIYESIQRNYELLENWERAAWAARAFLNQMNLKGASRERQQRLIHLYEERALDSLGEAEDDT